MNATNNIEFRKVRDLGQIITVAFSFFKYNFRPLMTAYLYLLALPLLILAAVFGLVLGQSVFYPDVFNISDAEGISLIVIIVLAVLIFAFLLPAIAYTYVAHYVNDGFGNFDFRDIRRTIRNHVWRILGVGLISTIFIVIGFFLCILPGIYLLVPLSMSLIILLHEENSVIDTIERCFQLVRDNWWQSFGILFVLWLISYMIQTVFIIPQFALILGAALMGESTDMSRELGITVFGGLFLLTLLIQYVGVFFTSVYMYVGISFQYFNLMEDQSRSSLIDRIDQIRTDDEPPADLTPPEII